MNIQKLQFWKHKLGDGCYEQQLNRILEHSQPCQKCVLAWSPRTTSNITSHWCALWEKRRGGLNPWAPAATSGTGRSSCIVSSNFPSSGCDRCLGSQSSNGRGQTAERRMLYLNLEKKLFQMWLLNFGFHATNIRKFLEPATRSTNIFLIADVLTHGSKLWFRK